jgi:hypothetical protein
MIDIISIYKFTTSGIDPIDSILRLGAAGSIVPIALSNIKPSLDDPNKIIKRLVGITAAVVMVWLSLGLTILLRDVHHPNLMQMMPILLVTALSVIHAIFEPSVFVTKYLTYKDRADKTCQDIKDQITWRQLAFESLVMMLAMAGLFYAAIPVHYAYIPLALTLVFPILLPMQVYGFLSMTAPLMAYTAGRYIRYYIALRAGMLWTPAIFAVPYIYAHIFQ